MDFTQFYLVLFGNIDKDMTVEFDPDVRELDETLAIGRGQRGLHERSCKIVHRGRQHHFINSVHFGVDLVSEQVVEALKHIGATGWDIFPITIKGGALEPNFFGLVVPSTCGLEQTDQTRAACRLRRGQNGEALPLFFGRYFHPSQWDGSDIFRFDNQATMIVHRRVLDEFLRRGIRVYAAVRLDHAESNKRLIEHWKEEES